MTKVFINLSNHPVATWSDQQKNEAEKFGTIVEMPFPQIDPMATADEVFTIAQTFYDKVMAINAETPVAGVHLMGEFTFTHALVDLFNFNATPDCTIRCFVSTTVRRADKFDLFQFKQFREYRTQSWSWKQVKDVGDSAFV